MQLLGMRSSSRVQTWCSPRCPRASRQGAEMAFRMAADRPGVYSAPRLLCIQARSVPGGAGVWVCCSVL